MSTSKQNGACHDEPYVTNKAELYFLIQKFLSWGPLEKTRNVLMRELEEHNIYQKRLDWLGNKHNRSFEDMEHQFSFIRSDYLLEICNHIADISGKTTSTIPMKNFKSMLKYKPKKLIESDHNFKQLFSYISRIHQAPVRSKELTSNLVNIMRGREISGPIPRNKFVMSKTYSSLQVQRKTLGHLSSVYCLLFDATGRYIFTGADDLLVKLWSATTGRLLNSFRGAQFEISDISVNIENTLLAAGSLDHILRVWNIQTGYPVAVLEGHTAMITTVNFCPSTCWNIKYLVSTGSDGTVAFWSYFTDNDDGIIFKPNPIVYQEKMRPGGAKMITSAFSPGGAFLATGSADHNVRVYYMKGDDGPQRILESELHTDRVDSIQWAHSGLRFLSGGKDGSAIVWYFEFQQWKQMFLHISLNLNGEMEVEDAKKLKEMKVTMVAWDISDEVFVTAVNDYSLKVWAASNGKLKRILTGHTDEIYILECHPFDKGLMLSAGHDGQAFIWDIFKGEIITRYLNSIEGQGVAAIYDGKWSPDGTMVALSDSHGRIITFGFGPGSTLLQHLPTELFFHTDYRPLIRDQNHEVLDEQTQMAPHLMPPPFLVDIDGNPYPPILQKLVPGRENCPSEQLIPNIVIRNAEGGQEVLQGVFQQDENEGNRSRNLNNNRRSRDFEGIRQSTGEWQREPNKMKWKQNVLVPPLKCSELVKINEDIEYLAQVEIEEYHKQMRAARPHMINTSNVAKPSACLKQDARRLSKRIVKKNKRSMIIVYKPESSGDDDVDYNSSDYSDWVLDEGVHLEPPKRSKRRQVTHRFTTSSDTSDDEVAESELCNGVEEPSTSSFSPPKREPRKKPRVKPHEVDEKYKPSEWLSETKPRKSPYFPQMGDELVYFVQGHQLYVEAVIAKDIYKINSRDLPWHKTPLKDCEFLKIVGIRYEIKPPRVCCLKLAFLDEHGKSDGRFMTVKYHDVADVLDFLVLKQSYDVAISRNWSVGDRFRCMIYDEWWLGVIISSSLEEQPDSPFLCYEIKWDNGETERMSPWDLEPVDQTRVPTDPSEAVPVLEEEIKAILYQSIPDDWSNVDVETAHQNILSGLSKIMELAIAEHFLAPVDLNTYPDYAYIIEYPIDLSTIRSRFEYRFYRRITAAQFDIRYLASNTEKYNEKHTDIVKHARILTDLCLRVVKQCESLVDVSDMYRSMLNSYLSSDNEAGNDIVDDVNLPSTSNAAANSYERNHSGADNFRAARNEVWKSEALGFLNRIWESEDSVPFRQPVNKFRYPDYYTVIRKPMDLTTIREKLEKDDYRTPYEFSEDMKLIFENSKTYNTNPKSRIYLMTARLCSAFEKHQRRLFEKWRTARRKSGRVRKTAGNSSSASSSGESEKHEVNVEFPNRTPPGDDDLDEEIDEEDVGTTSVTSSSGSSQTPTSSDSSTFSRSKRKKIRKKRESNTGNSSSSDDNQPISNYINRHKSVKRPRRKVQIDKYENEGSDDDDDNNDDDDDEGNANLRERRSTRRPMKYLSSEGSEIEERCSKRRNGEGGSKFLTTVSSRGRIRKITARAQALMKK